MIDLCKWGIHYSSEVVTKVKSIGRINSYCRLEPEPSLRSVAKHRPPTGWPDSGALNFSNASFKYDSDSEFILKNLTFYIKSGVSSITLFMINY